MAWHLFCLLPSALCLALALLLTGCGDLNKDAKAGLTEGFTALEEKQYDQAMSRADEFLQKKPTGPGSAEALYLKGRVFEQRTANNPNEVRANLQSARDAYLDALNRAPAPKLKALIHSGLANVAYFQDDYTTAVMEWTNAYDKLEDKDAKAWTMYRIGVSRQRLGQFPEADNVFVSVQQEFPNTVPAQRAKEHQGARSFSVQLATLSSAPAADTAINNLRREGVMASKQTDSRGRTVIFVGPIPTYQQAQSLKARYASTYRDALILP